jgi:hypothetical protein
MVDSVDELRLEAAKAARRINEKARTSDEARMIAVSVCARLGKASIYDVAESDPQTVIDIASGLDDLTDEAEVPRWMG